MCIGSVWSYRPEPIPVVKTIPTNNRARPLRPRRCIVAYCGRRRRPLPHQHTGQSYGSCGWGRARGLCPQRSCRHHHRWRRTETRWVSHITAFQIFICIAQNELVSFDTLMYSRFNALMRLICWLIQLYSSFRERLIFTDWVTYSRLLSALLHSAEPQFLSFRLTLSLTFVSQSIPFPTQCQNRFCLRVFDNSSPLLS